MTGEEKLRRIQQPSCSADYALAMTEGELRSFPAGRQILRDLQPIRDMQKSEMDSIYEAMGGAANSQVERVTYGVLTIRPNGKAQGFKRRRAPQGAPPAA
jgi:hypothetical protein